MSSCSDMWNELLFLMRQREEQRQEKQEELELLRKETNRFVKQFECGVDSNTGVPYLRRRTLGFFK